MKSKKTLVLNSNSDPVFGPLATAINGESGILTATITSDGVVTHNANFNKYGAAISGIPDTFATITIAPADTPAE